MMKTKDYPILSAPAGQCVGRTPSDPVRPSVFALGLGGFLFIALCTLWPSPAGAQCKQWNVGGRWVLQQSSGHQISVDLQQSGTNLSGQASFGTATAGTKVLGVLVEGGDPKTQRGLVSGNIQGDDLYMKIEWGHNSAGIYRGKVGPQGRIEGSTYDQKSPASKATWVSESAMNCADAAPVSPGRVIGRIGKPPVPVPPGRVIGRTGKSPTANPPVVARDVNDPNARGPFAGAARAAEAASQAAREAEAKAQSGSSGAPRITASPANAIGGSTTLAWDGGPEHPYAEVWVGVDGQDPTFVVEQGKGSRRVTVEPGKTYRYILTDSGRDLSTVTVEGRQ